MLGHQRGQRVEVGTVGPRGHRHQPGPGQREALQRGQVGRVLDEDDVSRIQQRGCGKAERLLGAGGDQHVVGVGREPATLHPGCERHAQRFVALRGRVLQRPPGPPVDERIGEGGAQRGHVEQLRGRKSTRERDDLLACGQREDLTHRGGAHPGEPLGGRGRGDAGELHRRPPYGLRSPTRQAIRQERLVGSRA